MAALAQFLPLVVAGLLLALPAATRVSPRADEAANRLALGLFGSYVAEPTSRRSRRRNVVLSAHMNVMYRVYAARTLLFAAMVALAGSILGLYVIVLGIELLAVPVSTMERLLPARLEFLAANLTLPTLSVLQVFVLFTLSSATFGTASGIGTYLYRWSRPTRIADRRETQIEESLPRTVAFMFALSRSGMSHKTLVKTLARNSVYFGEAAEEFIISLRYMELSNTDFLSATQRLARTTPSTEFANFAEDLTDVLRTGRPMSEYFREEYEQYQQDKESRQERILEQLAALAEGYVALLVAGPLFLITILVIIGLLGGGTLDILRVFIYLVVPVASVGFMLYLGDLAAGLGIDANIGEFSLDTSRIRPDATEEGGSNVDDVGRSTPITTDGGRVVGDPVLGRLAVYDRLRDVRRQLARPIETALQSPDTVLYVATPIAASYALLGGTSLYLNDALTLRAIDDFLIQATLFALGTFAVVEYSSDRRLRRIERALPDLIDRLADRTEAGMSFTRAIRELEPSSVPGLELEIRELRADLDWGGKTSEALTRFAERTRSVFAVRAVILIVNAVHASGDVAPVLRIAADEAQTDRRLDRRRRQELLVYLIIIYVSFLVFLGIIVALVLVFIPALPSAEQLTGQVATDSAAGGTGLGSVGLGGASAENRAAYSLVVFHASVVQGVVAGFTAGKLSQGSIRAGAKHATVMVAIAYAAMLLLA